LARVLQIGVEASWAGISGGAFDALDAFDAFDEVDEEKLGDGRANRAAGAVGSGTCGTSMECERACELAGGARCGDASGGAAGAGADAGSDTADAESWRGEIHQWQCAGFDCGRRQRGECDCREQRENCAGGSGRKGFEVGDADCLDGLAGGRSNSGARACVGRRQNDDGGGGHRDEAHGPGSEKDAGPRGLAKARHRRIGERCGSCHWNDHNFHGNWSVGENRGDSHDERHRAAPLCAGFGAVRCCEAGGARSDQAGRSSALAGNEERGRQRICGGRNSFRNFPQPGWNYYCD